MGLSATHLLLLLVAVVLLFGRGRISDLMGDVGRGIKSFKNAMSEDAPAADPKAIDQANQSGATERDKSKTS